MADRDAPVILLTGASGVVGSAISKRSSGRPLLLATHRVTPTVPAETIRIDIQRPDLGLEPVDHDTLAGRLTGIIHSAAITEMGSAAPGLDATNVDGVKHVLALANRARCPIHYISTAYCSNTYGPRAAHASAYVQSKRTAESLVRQSDLDWTIIRPSIVAGHSKTGAIASFQGFHLFIAAMLKGRLPFIPLNRSARCDFTPVDWVADAIDRVLDAPEFGRTYWLTSGHRALTVEEMIATGRPFAAALGRDLDALPIVDPDEARCQLLPQVKAKGSRRLTTQLETLLELASVMATPLPFPSDLPDIAPEALSHVLSANIRYWGETTGRPFAAEIG